MHASLPGAFEIDRTTVSGTGSAPTDERRSGDVCDVRSCLGNGRSEYLRCRTVGKFFATEWPLAPDGGQTRVFSPHAEIKSAFVCLHDLGVWRARSGTAKPRPPPEPETECAYPVYEHGPLPPRARARSNCVFTRPKRLLRPAGRIHTHATASARQMVTG